MMGAAMGERHSIAIVQSWAPSYKVISMPADEFDAAVERTHTDYHGQTSDLDEIEADLA
jgi:hypothetical protein